MRIKTLLLTLLLALFAMPALAQDDAAGNRVLFNGFAFQFPSALSPNVNISWYPGDPVEGAGPGFTDASHLQFTLYSAFPVPESQWDSNGGIRVYGIDAIAQFDFLKAQYDQLQAMLAERSDLANYEVTLGENMANSLPYLPVLPHGQIIRARASYIETTQVKGISYLTYSNATAEPFLNSSFTYTFQGITSDGNLYISASFPVETGLFPVEPPTDFNMETFMAELPDYLAETIVTLESAQPDDFSPSLTQLDTLIQSFTLEE